MGDNNDIREFAQLHRSSAADLCTVLGDGNLLMGGCHVAHDCHVGHRNIMANNTLLAGHVQARRIALTRHLQHNSKQLSQTHASIAALGILQDDTVTRAYLTSSEQCSEVK
jgi:acyl-[acyl carrier protein]--UDP-N-acetylglucosamine O-acyltransferase